jgi:cyanate permease
VKHAGLLAALFLGALALRPQLVGVGPLVSEIDSDLDVSHAVAGLLGTIGAMFPLTLTLPVDIAHEPAGTGAVGGLMLGAGYTIAAVGPILLGAVRDATGSFATSLWQLVALAAALVAAILPLSPRRLRPPARLPAEAVAP